jgi:hypothetical protein
VMFSRKNFFDVKSFFSILRARALIASLPSFWRERTEVRVVREECVLTLSRDGRGNSSVKDFFRAKVI